MSLCSRGSHTKNRLVIACATGDDIEGTDRLDRHVKLNTSGMQVRVVFQPVWYFEKGGHIGRGLASFCGEDGGTVSTTGNSNACSLAPKVNMGKQRPATRRSHSNSEVRRRHDSEPEHGF